MLHKITSPDGSIAVLELPFSTPPLRGKWTKSAAEKFGRLVAKRDAAGKWSVVMAYVSPITKQPQPFELDLFDDDAKLLETLTELKD